MEKEQECEKFVDSMRSKYVYLHLKKSLTTIHSAEKNAILFSLWIRMEKHIQYKGHGTCVYDVWTYNEIWICIAYWAWISQIFRWCRPFHLHKFHILPKKKINEKNVGLSQCARCGVYFSRFPVLLFILLPTTSENRFQAWSSNHGKKGIFTYSLIFCQQPKNEKGKCALARQSQVDFLFSLSCRSFAYRELIFQWNIFDGFFCRTKGSVICLYVYARSLM